MITNKKNKQLTRAALVAVVLAIFALPAAAEVELTFEGYSWYIPTLDFVGSTMMVAGVANPPAIAPPPMVMDFDNYEYTIWIDEMVVSAFVYDMADQKQVTDFTGGVIRIFRDLKAGGTPADFAVPATFTDGEMILAAMVHDGWKMQLADPFGMSFAGSGVGLCDFFDGIRLADLIEIGGQPYLENWTFAGTGISDPGFFVTVPDGYDRLFGVKLVYPEPVAVEGATWGELKSLFN